MEEAKGLNVETLNKLIELIVPNFDSEEIDKFVEEGNKIEHTVLITSLEFLKGVSFLRTKHGMLQVKHNPYFPCETTVLFKMPESPFMTYKGC